MSKLNVYKRKNGRYEGQVYLGKDKNEKRRYKSYYGMTVEEVYQKYNHSTQCYANTNYPITEMTIKELVSEWLNVMKARIKESTA